MKFTIAIPAYKARYFRECLVSVLSQSYKDFEVIILNDKSPENLRDIIDDFDDHRIRYYENDMNVGAVNLVDNWNKCLSLAEGEFIICIGDDDKLMPDCLYEYRNLILKYPNVDVFHGWTELINANSDFYSLQERRPEVESVYSMMWHRMNGRVQYIGDFCYRTEKLKAIGGFYKLPLAWGSDDLTSYMMADTNGIVNSQSLLFQYRVNPLTISNTGGARIKIKAISLENTWFKTFLGTIPEDLNDQKYYTLIRKSVDKYFYKKKVLLISNDLRPPSLRKLFFWLRAGKKFNISRLMLIKASFHAIAIHYGLNKSN